MPRVRVSKRRGVVALIPVAIIGSGALWMGVVGRSSGPAAMPWPRFVEATAEARLDHVYDGGFEFYVGGGVAVFDCDDDGRQELFLPGGANEAALYRNESAIGGALRMERIADPATDLASVTGAYPLDIDGDRRTDLAVLRVGEDVLLRGLGDCRFERANEPWTFDADDAWTTSFSARWEDSETLPTLAFGNYILPDEQGDWAGCADNALVRPSSGSGYAPPEPLTGWCTLSMLFSDWDRSGRRDLRVSNDRHYYPETSDGEEQLWRIDRGSAPRAYTRDDGWRSLRIWGMGIASHDLTGDGYPEVYLTSQGDNKLQTLAEGPGRPAYEDIAVARGAEAGHPYAGDVALPSTGWHAEFQDVNNDTFVDLFVAKGNVEAMPDYAARDPSNLLLGQADGTFVETADRAGIVSFARTRGAALVDLNLDGLLDLVAVHRREPVTLWRSVGWGTAEAPAPMGHWIAIRLDQPEPNHDAVGAWVEVRAGERTVEREVTVGGGHAGGQLGWIHFGLGASTTAEVRVRWPDGTQGPWQAVPADGFAILGRDAEPLAWDPAL
jgi:hypothetical protein